jgi:hypothetical protein
MYYLRYQYETAGAYPISIMSIGNSSDSGRPEEYLIAFNEMGVFVDSYGLRTREEDVVWSRAPTAFRKILYSIEY